MKILLLLIIIDIVWASTYTMERGSSITLQCPNTNDSSGPAGSSISGTIKPGPPGKKGPQGPPGPPGPPGEHESDSALRGRYDDRIQELEEKVEELTRASPDVGTITNPADSCSTIKRTRPVATNGLFYIKDSEGNVFTTYCDMLTGGGGWTLVASVHENNMKGKCTTGDRWSSEQGNSADHPHGDGFWENRAVHGAASSATSDDYKNSGYFALQAEDVMIWQVPNDTPLQEYEANAFLKYRTTNRFLPTYGGNLQSLFAEHYPMRSKVYTPSTDNGPAIPITWDRGSNELIMELIPPSGKEKVDPGYIQFRAINHRQNAFALCQGVRIKPSSADGESFCAGSTSFNIGRTNEEAYCGDFGAKDWEFDPGWKADDRLIKSAILIFYL